MKIARIIKHLLIVTVSIFMLAFLPIATHFDFFEANDDADAVSGASLELPDQPSGDFMVFINSDLHSDTMEEWTKFFTGTELPVIFEDIECITARGDAAGKQLADRFMIQLPENQMKVREEDPTLTASKLESGYIDISVMSSEMADALDLATAEDQAAVSELVADGKPVGVTVLRVSGGA